MRVIALVDMDCFYCQVEEKLNPELQGKPVAVVQYNLWREGGIIAANYLAKAKGVTKGMWKHEAKDLCPEIQFARVAELRGRADLTKYREAGNQVVDVLSTFPILLERASIDEAYLDLTEAANAELGKGISSIPLDRLKTTHIVGYNTAEFISSISSDQDTDGFCEDDLKLAIGGIIVEKMRSDIYEKTGYRCSAGIAQNKILAKLVCGLHKPNKQTILPGNAIPQFLSELPLKKIKRLGGKFGKKLAEELNISKVGELLNFPQEELSRKFDSKVGQWLYNIARGIDKEPVQPKLLSKSISCCKRFPGKNALFHQKDVEYWINELALEVAQRLAIDREQHNRKAKMATVSYVQCVNLKDVNISKTFSLRSYESSIIAQDAFEILKKFCNKSNGLYYLKYLGISVGTFENLKNIKGIKFFFEKKNEKVKQEINDMNSSKLIEMNMREEKDKHEDSELQKICDLQHGTDISSISMSNSSTGELRGNHSSHNDGNSFDTEEKISKNCDCNEELCDEGKDSIKENSSSHSESDEEIDEENMKHSFFVRYFSKIANKNIVDCENESSAREEDNESRNSENVDEAIAKRDCEECGMAIGVDEISSHMDYHFALKLHEQDKSADDNSSPGSDQSCKKRKFVDYESASTFSTPHKLMTTTESTELCEICNQEISISEVLSHSDYHTAKNLEKIWNAENISADSIRNNAEKIMGNTILRYIKRKSS